MPLFDGDFPDWKPFSRIAGIVWLVFYLPSCSTLRPTAPVF